MIRQVLYLLLLLPIWMHASILDWFNPLSPKAQRAKTILDNLDPVIEKAIADYQIPGVAVGVVVDGHVVYAKGFGYRDLEEKLPMTPDTLLSIGSCTKAFTGFVAGTLVDEGLLHWDQLMIDLIPEFRLWDQYATQNVTLRDLLTHRSGMPRHDGAWYNSKLTRAQLMSRLRYLEPSTDIRERYQYNHIMYSTAGYALERICNKSWEQLVRERILVPLHMTNTNFSFAEMQQSSNFAHPYLEKKGVLKKIPGRDVSLIGPAASINSSINELVNWVQLHLNEGTYGKQVLISPTTLQEIWAPQTIVPEVPETTDTLMHAYGIGWNIYAYRSLYSVMHHGATEGYTCTITFVPKEKVGVIVLCNKNLTTLPAYLSLDILDKVVELPPRNWLDVGRASIQREKEAANKQAAKEDLLRKKGTSPSHPLDEFVGTYEHPGYGAMTVDVKNGQLQAHFNGITSTLEHWHYDVFAIAEESEDRIAPLEGMKFTFLNNVDGDIGEVHVPFEPGAGHIVFKRMKEASLSDITYLRKFCGIYEVSEFTVEVAVRNNALCVIIPTFPTYELVAVGKDKFALKEMMGSSIEFYFDDQGLVSHALVYSPYANATAKPKNR